MRGTIFGCCLSALRSDIYLSALEGIPSSSPSNLMYFTATYLLFLSTALKTLPKAPSPMVQISISY